ncbi:hypothetical protein M413DRAFT_323930 [Hebeloma cylindrosporum]|uniref:Nephrocystin 3-like N-terminal domain-containing protein n=1 Tax=Hebeloma cylindrosporum TaxID=76867 RepID=A0A0C2Y4H5_HEBCY|nr:hypothetical protein M413DRAFT_323930 [Hebeloma cylindrosporum h7]
MFSRSINPTVNGGTFQVHNHWGTIGGFERLQSSVATSAFHDSGEVVDPPKCHPNTRTSVINKIMDWILRRGIDDQRAVVLWLYGPAGAGKSAIAHKIAELCKLEELLLASFFFYRSDPARSNAKSLIATIAYQIAIKIPGTREKIIATVERDPLILTRSLEAQATALLVDPLRELEVGYTNKPDMRRLIIIDGLDECDVSTVQCNVLESLSCLFHHYDLPLLILIASRPERHLTHSFTTGSLAKFHTTLALDDTYKPDDDIRLFLTDKFRQIKDTHPMRHYMDHSWPSSGVLKGLVEKSSGQFIYASTVVEYVSSIRHNPADCLSVVLGIQSPRYCREMPFKELDALYTTLQIHTQNPSLNLKVPSLNSEPSSPTSPKSLDPPRDDGELSTMNDDLGFVPSVTNGAAGPASSASAPPFRNVPG